MELDLTAQLQPVVWGLLIAMLASACALVVAADRDELDLLWRYRHLRDAWRRHLRALQARLLARARMLIAHRVSQPASRERGNT